MSITSRHAPDVPARVQEDGGWLAPDEHASSPATGGGMVPPTARAGCRRPVHTGTTDEVTRDDRELLAAHVAGDPAAFGELARRHQRSLWVIASRLMRHQQDAEDALQEGLVKAFRGASTYRGDGGASVAAWLRSIVIRTSYTQLARRGRVLDRFPSGDDVLRRAEARCSSCEDTSVIEAALEEALTELPEAFRAVFVLTVVHDLSEVETADALGIAVGTVKSRMSRARARLAEHLQPVLHQSER